MGQPAARVGDTTSHGTPLLRGPAVPTVLIGGSRRGARPPIRTCARCRWSEAARRRRGRSRKCDGDDRRSAGRAAGRHGG